MGKKKEGAIKEDYTRRILVGSKKDKDNMPEKKTWCPRCQRRRVLGTEWIHNLGGKDLQKKSATEERSSA